MLRTPAHSLRFTSVDKLWNEKTVYTAEEVVVELCFLVENGSFWNNFRNIENSHLIK